MPDARSRMKNKSDLFGHLLKKKIFIFKEAPWNVRMTEGIFPPLYHIIPCLLSTHSQSARQWGTAKGAGMGEAGTACSHGSAQGLRLRPDVHTKGYIIN